MTRQVTSDIPAPLNATFDVPPEGDARYALITRLSVAGAELMMPDPPAVGTEVRLRASLGCAADQTCLTGRVRWSEHGRLGVQFESVGVRETRAILDINRAAWSSATL